MHSEKSCTFAVSNYSDLDMERIYIDTSVFGGYFETEFEQWTKPFIEKFVIGEYKLLYSQLTELELQRAPRRVRNLVTSVPVEHLEFLPVTAADNLANLYRKTLLDKQV